jgi:uncharacterized phage protein (TIGR02220 family)
MYFKKRKRSSPFVIVDKNFVNRTDLSWKAKGILLYLMSLPENWKLSMEDLKNRSTDGAAALRTGIKELEEKKYFQKISIRNEKGKIIKWEYIFDEIPIEDESEEITSEKEVRSNKPECENQNEGQPECDYPDVENQHVENRRLQSNNNKQNNNKQNNNNIVELFDLGKQKIKKNSEIINEIICYLNEKVGSNFRSSTSNTKYLIKKLIDDGYGIEDFKKVIDKKTDQWLNTNMQKYLRPITLFRASNFENYLNELVSKGGKNEKSNKFFKGPTEDYYQKEFDPTKANIQ